MLTKNQAVLSWVLQLTVAVIIFQTLFFKFTGAEESVYIFTTLRAEPWGRFGSAIVELIAVGLILCPPTAAFGALLTLGIGVGALLSHTILGVVVQNDGGLLFTLAVTVFLCSVVVLFLRRGELPVVGRLLSGLAA